MIRLSSAGTISFPIVLLRIFVWLTGQGNDSGKAVLGSAAGLYQASSDFVRTVASTCTVVANPLGRTLLEIWDQILEKYAAMFWNC